MTGLADRFALLHGRVLSEDGRAHSFTEPKRKFTTIDKTGPFQTRPTKKRVGFTEYEDFETSIWSDLDLQTLLLAFDQTTQADWLLMWGRDGDAAGANVNMANLLHVEVHATTEIASETEWLLKFRPDANGVLLGKALTALAAITANGNTQASAVNNGVIGSAIAITSSSVANPTVITATAHGFETGDTVLIAGHTSTPTLNGSHVVTVLTPDTFTVPVNVTVGGGAAGTVTRTSTRYGGFIDVHVDAAAYDGGTGITFTGQDSPDGISFATATGGSFSAITTEYSSADPAVGTAVRAALTGSVDRYVAIAYAFGGSPGAGKSVTFKAAVARSEIPLTA